MRKRFVYDEKLKCMVPLTRPESCQAFGIDTKAKDPTSADVAVPRAFRQLEQQHSASRIACDAGFSVNEIKRTWGL